MKKRKLLILFGILVLSSCDISYFKKYNDTEYRELISSNCESFKEIQNLSIDWMSGDIIIKNSSNVKEIQISETASSTIKDEFKARIKYDEDKNLDINYCASNVTLVGLGSKTLEVLVPNDTKLHSLDINIISGNGISISNVDIVHEINIKTNSADVQLNNVSCCDLNIETNSGKISTSLCKSSMIDLITNSGDCYLKLNDSAKQITINSNSGDCIIDLDEKVLGYKIAFNSTSGNYKSEFKETQLYEYSNGILRIVCNTTSGNLIINKYNG